MASRGAARAEPLKAPAKVDNMQLAVLCGFCADPCQARHMSWSPGRRERCQDIDARGTQFSHGCVLQVLDTSKGVSSQQENICIVGTSETACSVHDARTLQLFRGKQGAV